MPTNIVQIKLPPNTRDYDIIIGDGVLGETGNLVKSRLGQRKCVIITDLNVAEHYLQIVEAILASAGHDVLPSIVISPGESSKDFNTLQYILNQLFERKIDRKTLIIAFGGGVVGDISGFTASLVFRGIDIVQIPTSLLAQVDSSVGGKTGINSTYGKNTIGAFHQPKLVIADVKTLDSLPDRELRSGYAEVVKHGLINDPDFFLWCQDHGDKLLRGDKESQVYAVSKSCKIKAEIVASDEHETGDRALLNLGHTFGHALEAILGYNNRILHGEAVAIGMAMTFRLSADLGICSQSDAILVQNHLKNIGLSIKPPQLPYDVDQLMALMAQDKKAQNGKLTLVLAKAIGKCFISNDVNPAPVRALWKSSITS